jgi:hypothetical protein
MKEGVIRFPKSKIPLTERYCLNCKRRTTWEYNPSIFHSECCVCSCRTAIFPTPFKEFFKFCAIYEWSMEGKTENNTTLKGEKENDNHAK